MPGTVFGVHLPADKTLRFQTSQDLRDGPSRYAFCFGKGEGMDALIHTDGGDHVDFRLMKPFPYPEIHDRRADLSRLANHVHEEANEILPAIRVKLQGPSV